MISFFAIAISGIVLHFFAVDFTRIITASGIGQEGNPLYYLLGPSNFIAFGFAVVICYYCCMWYVDIPFKYKIIAASCLTSVTAFDFLHDLLYYILTSHV